MKAVYIRTKNVENECMDILMKLGVLVALCDIDKNKKKINNKLSISCYHSTDLLLESEEFDTVFIYTNDDIHMPIIDKFIKKKKNIFIENLDMYFIHNWEKSVKLSEANNIKLSYSLTGRFNPFVNIIKNYLDLETYGKLVMLQTHSTNIVDNMCNVRDIYDLLIRDIDVVLWLFDDVPEIVYAITNNIQHKYSDIITVTFGFSNNRVATISLDLIINSSVKNFNVVCTDGLIFYNNITQNMVIKTNNKVLTINNIKKQLLLEIINFSDTISAKPMLKVKKSVNITKIVNAIKLSSKNGIPIYLNI